MELFLSMLYLSTFTFGGGYVIISLMKEKFVQGKGWITEEEMLNYAAIAQSAPGPIAVNASILVGYHVAGISGAAVSVLGTIIPPVVIISVISFFYTAFRTNAVVSAVLRGMQSGVGAVIAGVVLDLGGHVVKSKEIISILLMLGAFAATYFFKVNVIYVILACACIGAARGWISMRKEVRP